MYTFVKTRLDTIEVKGQIDSWMLECSNLNMLFEHTEIYMQN